MPDTRESLLGNEIVLVVPKDFDRDRRDRARASTSPRLLGADGRLAMANVDSVPAGKYGKAALESLGVWDAVADRVVQADNVRAALAFVARGEAPAGIVYATDADAEPAVKVVGTFPADSHPPIVYPGGADRGVDEPGRPRLPRLSRSRTRRGRPSRSRASRPRAGDRSAQPNRRRAG